MDYNIIIPDKHKFLQIIGNLAKVPERLYIRGNVPKDRVPTIAIVGTRKPTAYGKEVTYQLAYELAQKGIVIISGLAFGVDALAHRAALDAGGTTIAVLGNSIDTIYPRSNQKLADEILTKGGAIISEYPPQTTTYPSNFLARNRLVAALSDSVIVTEAAARSGSLSTVNHALEQGKDVYAVPGNITSPMSAGCNEIIKQGAIPLTGIGDIIKMTRDEPSDPIALLIKGGARTVEQLMERSGLDTAALLQQLTMLEISGNIRRLSANEWTTG